VPWENAAIIIVPGEAAHHVVGIVWAGVFDVMPASAFVAPGVLLAGADFLNSVN
jgi:hypothetical protein